MDSRWVQSGPSVGLKRKSVNVNGDGGGSTFVGVDGFRIRWDSVLATSSEEKRDLRRRLQLQLEQVEGLTMQITARQEQLLKGADGSVRASHSDDEHLSRTDNWGSDGKEGSSQRTSRTTESNNRVREARLARQPSGIISTHGSLGSPGTAGKEKRTPKPNHMYLNSEFVSGKDKMRPPEELKSERGARRKVESGARDDTRVKVESARSKRMADMMKQCAALLKKLVSRKHAWVFNEPVDAVKLGLSDYHKFIKKPMDLGTIKKRLDSGSYTAPMDFAADVRLTFSNAMIYNPTGHDVYVVADVLLRLFEERWKNIEEKVEEDRSKMEIEDDALANEGTGLKQRIRTRENKMQSLAKKRPAGGRPPAQPKPRPNDVEKREMVYEEKCKLAKALLNVPQEKSDRIVQIISKRHPNVSQNEHSIEVDMESLDNDTLWELDRFVTNWAKSKGKVKKKAATKEPGARPDQDGAQLADNRTAEPFNEKRKVGEAEEEDVDIDDDITPPQYQPVVIEKNGIASSSSSSSSTSSDSSSSDSDSASTSGSGSDAEEPQNVEVTEKASLAAGPEVSKSEV